MKKYTTAFLVYSTALQIIIIIISSGCSRQMKTELEKEHLGCVIGISADEHLKNIDKFGIINIFLRLTDQFPEEQVKTLTDMGKNVMITWEPYIKDFSEDSILPDIISGKYDIPIGEFALAVKNSLKPVYLRWGHEMNGNWYPWCGANNTEDARVYIDSFLRIYNIFAETGCNNVLFVFSINYEDVPAQRWNRFERYYPGDKYIDIIGLDVYNWGTAGKWGTRSRWRQPDKLIKKPYKRCLRLTPDKPIFITEVGTTSQGGDKKIWLERFFFMIKNRYTQIKALLWFDINKETDWGISHEKDVFDAFSKYTSDSFFTSSPDSLEWILKEKN